jgi:hypothetical protein
MTVIKRHTGGIDMARPKTKGLEYFSIDTNASESREIEYLEAIHGLVGYSVFIKLLERIYGHEGYFIRWTDMDQTIFAKRCGLESSQVKAIIETCFDANIFSRWVYDANHVLTSAGIQKRYLKATERRTDVFINEEYTPDCCKKNTHLNRNNHSTGLAYTETPHQEGEASTESTQSKVKESKGKESKEPKTKGQPFVLPSWVPSESWQGFDDMRTAKSKKAWTDRARTLAVMTLEKLTTNPKEAGAILDQSVMKGWAGIFPVKNQDAGYSDNGKLNYIPSKGEDLPEWMTNLRTKRL